ncbi:MAG: hypothetical protein JST64_10820 [Actinobacteria bacterium]|nr:hypothetical protein [Actinomycetota bacterium]
MGSAQRHSIATRDPGPDDGVVDPSARNHRLTRWADRLPSGRATLGAALVVVAAAGVLSAHRAATRPSVDRFVVVSRDVEAGTKLTPQDLGTLAMDLPDGMAAVSAAEARSLVGDTTVHRLRALDLVRRSDLDGGVGAPAPGSVEVPVEVDRARSLGSAAHAGSRVDVLSTDPEGTGTVVLASNALVVAVDHGDRGIGSSGGSRFRLALPDPTTAAAVVDASVRARLTLVLPDQGAARG